MRKSLATQRDHGGAGDVAGGEYGRCSVGPELGVPRQCYEPSRRLDAASRLRALSYTGPESGDSPERREVKVAFLCGYSICSTAVNYPVGASCMQAACSDNCLPDNIVLYTPTYPSTLPKANVSWTIMLCYIARCLPA